MEKGKVSFSDGVNSVGQNRDITQLVNELTDKLSKTRYEKHEIEKQINDLNSERQKITDIIDQLSIEHDKL